MNIALYIACGFIGIFIGRLTTSISKRVQILKEKNESLVLRIDQLEKDKEDIMKGMLIVGFAKRFSDVFVNQSKEDTDE